VQDSGTTMVNAPTLNSSEQTRFTFTIFLILLVGFCIRIYLLVRIPFISADSYLYLQQAKALYQGRFDELLTCYHYLSPYPLAVSFFYTIFGDWITAAKSVNIFFGTFSIGFMYLLLRRFFNDVVSSFTALTFALLPVFARVSADGLRDPMFWFFSILGFYLFMIYIENHNKRFFILFSSLSFLFAAWARMEAILYILTGLLFIIFSRRKNKFGDVFYFFAPYLFFLIVLISISFLGEITMIKFLNPKRVFEIPVDFISQYRSTRNYLISCIQPETPAAVGYFLERVKRLLWIIAPVAVVVLIAEALMYAFFALLLIGMVSNFRDKLSDRKMWFFCLVMLGATILLIFHTLYLWHAAERHLAVFLIPSFIFIGSGFERLYEFFNKSINKGPFFRQGVIYTIIFTTLLPKIFLSNYNPDMTVYKDIGTFISTNNKYSNKPITVCAPFKQVRDIHFYANYNLPLSPCLDPNSFFKGPDKDIFLYVCQKNFQFLVCNSARLYDGPETSSFFYSGCRLTPLKEWKTEKYETLVLYEVVK
jgi:hypothetical protein